LLKLLMTDFPTVLDKDGSQIKLHDRVMVQSSIQDRLDIGTVVDYIEADEGQPPLLVIDFGNDGNDGDFEEYVIRYDGEGAFHFVPELQIIDPTVKPWE
jgi:hypothetical protein